MIGEMRDRRPPRSVSSLRSPVTSCYRPAYQHRRRRHCCLEDMGVERYLITSSVNGVLAQRLVRTLCSSCKEPVELSEVAVRKYNLQRFLPEGQTTVFQAKGCDHCGHTGYVVAHPFTSCFCWMTRCIA